MAAKWPAMHQPKGARLDNDASHGHKDPNSGGGPSIRNRATVPNSSRGGFGHRGTGVNRTLPQGGRSAPPLPNQSFTPVGRQSLPSEARIPGHGGSPQVRNNIPAPRGGGFGQPGQSGLPSATHSNPTPSGGNLSSRMARRIAGHFDNKSKGGNRGVSSMPRPSGGGGF